MVPCSTGRRHTTLGTAVVFSITGSLLAMENDVFSISSLEYESVFFLLAFVAMETVAILFVLNAS